MTSETKSKRINARNRRFEKELNALLKKHKVGIEPSGKRGLNIYIDHSDLGGNACTCICREQGLGFDPRTTDRDFRD